MAMACRGSAVCAWRSAPGAPQTARAMRKTLPAAARLRRRRIRGTQRGKLTAAMRLGDFGKYFHQIGQARAAWLGFESQSRPLSRSFRTITRRRYGFIGGLKWAITPLAGVTLLPHLVPTQP